MDLRIFLLIEHLGAKHGALDLGAVFLGNIRVSHLHLFGRDRDLRRERGAGSMAAMRNGRDHNVVVSKA